MSYRWHPNGKDMTVHETIRSPLCPGAILLAFLVLGWGLFGCNLLHDYREIDQGPVCDPGEVVDCPCVDGSTATQQCNEYGIFEPCQCDEQPHDAGSDVSDVDHDPEVSG